ncbi:MAG: GtrA family protein [Polaromonas sp.]|jgi:putative flippase GtrA|nr:GtrA family protein [Polaromonas sp.]
MIEKLKAMNFWQFFRYVVVGGLNTLLSLAVYYLGLGWLQLPYQAASALSVGVGILVGFKAHGALVFKSEGSFVRYVLIWTTIYLGNILLIALVRDVTGDYWAPVILLPVTTMLAYVLLKRFSFKQ